MQDYVVFLNGILTTSDIGALQIALQQVALATKVGVTAPITPQPVISGGMFPK